jgi:hypothetical protein
MRTQFSFARSIALRAAAALTATMLISGGLAAQQQDGGTVLSLTLRDAYSVEHHGHSPLVGVQFRGAGSTYLLGSVDVQLTRNHDSSGQPSPAPGTRVTRLTAGVPTLRVGLGHRGRIGGATAAVEAFAGQDGVQDGYSPDVGGGVAVGRDAWAVTVNGVMRQGRVAEYGTPPAEGLPAESPTVGRRWVPVVEAGVRWDAGLLGRSRLPSAGRVPNDRLGRPILGALAGGTLGAAAGFGVGLVAATGCTGDESCLLGAALGTVAGETVGVPLGIHLAEGRKGSLAAGIAASAALTAGGFALDRHIGGGGRASNAIAVVVPMAQIALCTWVERHTGRR